MVTLLPLPPLEWCGKLYNLRQNSTVSWQHNAYGIKYFICLASLGQPAWLIPSRILVKINPVLTKRRTTMDA